MHILEIAFIGTTSPPQKKRELYQTQLLLFYQFCIKTRGIHGGVQKFSKANFSINFRTIRHLLQSIGSVWVG
jgi:hypothetical protein